MATRHRIHPPTPAKETLGPLRKIVSEGYNEHGSDIEHLECGHTIHRRQDHMGYTNASSRRCWKCRDGFPLDRPADFGSGD